jgi:hypothetical protein
MKTCFSRSIRGVLGCLFSGVASPSFIKPRDLSTFASITKPPIKFLCASDTPLLILLLLRITEECVDAAQGISIFLENSGDVPDAASGVTARVRDRKDRGHFRGRIQAAPRRR